MRDSVQRTRRALWPRVSRTEAEWINGAGIPSVTCPASLGPRASEEVTFRLCAAAGTYSSGDGTGDSASLGAF